MSGIRRRHALGVLGAGSVRRLCLARSCCYELTDRELGFLLMSAPGVIDHLRN